MTKYKEKACTVCGNKYTPTGRCSKYCSTCKPTQYKLNQLKGYEAYRRRKGMEVGRGGKFGKDNQYYKHGQGTFRRWAKERKDSIGLCDFCGEDLSQANQHEWVGHHKDHNRMNNTIENLILLCKRCHQIEHKCWKAFEGVTTISKESRADNSPKRPTPEKLGDDIVCSVQ